VKTMISLSLTNLQLMSEEGMRSSGSTASGCHQKGLYSHSNSVLVNLQDSS